MALQAGEVVSSYEIVSQIGVGGMATVYKAYQPKLDRHVAIKVLHESFSQDANFMARFEREARIVARLDHPNIVPVYDYDDYHGRPYLVMKYVEGKTLKDLMRAGTASKEDIVFLMEKIGAALHFAHLAGILHRDIKPSNIIIDERGEPYLTDFGLARITQQGASTLSADTMLGTPHYISPEQAKGETELDARTDVYSLGVVLYELVTGRVPFIADTSYAVIHDQIYKAPPRPSEIDPNITPEIEMVVLRALAKDPSDRYATPVDMIADFRRAIVGTPGRHESRPQTEPYTPSTPPRQAPAPPSFPGPSGPPGPSGGFFQVARDLRHAEREVRQDLRAARKQVRNDLQQARRQLRRGMPSPSVSGRYTWRPGAKWATDIHGNQGFYTQQELDALEESLTEDERIRRRVKKRLDARKEYFVHLSMYVMVNLMLWAIWFLTMPGEFMWPLIPMAGWGIGIVAHSVEYYLQYGGGRDKLDEITQREMERERQRLYGDSYSGKVKNEDFFDQDDYAERQVRLTGDGELTDSFVEDQDQYRKRKNE